MLKWIATELIFDLGKKHHFGAWEVREKAAI
jgi:hypothetical protein